VIVLLADPLPDLHLPIITPCDNRNLPLCVHVLLEVGANVVRELPSTQPASPKVSEDILDRVHAQIEE
jgi:hypothetical protein